MNPVQPKRLEPECDHDAGCFRRKTLFPVRNANPVAELGSLVRRGDHEANGAAKFGARRNRERKGGPTSRAKFFLSAFQKTLRVLCYVGMRNVGGGGGDFARSRKPHDGGEVAAFDGTKKKSRSAQFPGRGHAVLGHVGISAAF